jgi:hypothetical protein
MTRRYPRPPTRPAHHRKQLPGKEKLGQHVERHGSGGVLPTTEVGGITTCDAIALAAPGAMTLTVSAMHVAPAADTAARDSADLL